MNYSLANCLRNYFVEPRLSRSEGRSSPATGYKFDLFLYGWSCPTVRMQVRLCLIYSIRTAQMGLVSCPFPRKPLLLDLLLTYLANCPEPCFSATFGLLNFFKEFRSYGSRCTLPAPGTPRPLDTSPNGGHTVGHSVDTSGPKGPDKIALKAILFFEVKSILTFLNNLQNLRTTFKFV